MEEPQVVANDEVFEYESYYVQDDENMSQHKRMSSGHSEVQEIINSLSKISKNKASKEFQQADGQNSVQNREDQED